MIKLENYEVLGWEHAIRGMRNPMNSWEKSDSKVRNFSVPEQGEVYPDEFVIGPNDHDLMMRLAKGGPVHAKYRRMITVYVDITAPLYWWKEFDTYKVGTVANSCSTMHKIHDKEFTLEDFSCEKLRDGWFGYDATFNVDIGDEDYTPFNILDAIIIPCLNRWRFLYNETKNKDYWDQMIQLLPSSYNQKRTVMLNYEVLHNIYHSRKNHKLTEWHDMCAWIESLPYSEIITVKENADD